MTSEVLAEVGLRRSQGVSSESVLSRRAGGVQKSHSSCSVTEFVCTDKRTSLERGR